MLERVENFLESTANSRSSLVTRQPQILSASLKLLVGTRGSIGTNDAKSALQRVEDSSKFEDRSSSLQSSLSIGDDDDANLISTEQFQNFLEHNIEGIVIAASSFSQAVVDHHSQMLTLGNLNERSGAEQSVNRILEQFDVEACVKVEKYLRELCFIDALVEDIQIADKDVIETRTKVSEFSKSHIEKAECIPLLQEASPLV